VIENEHHDLNQPNRSPHREESNMTKGELVNAVAKAANTSTKAAENAVNAIFENLARAIQKEKRFQVPRFGTFSVRTRKGRTVRNPQTGDVIHITASLTVGFKAAPNLKKRL
jgi:DNA-binding protein HU-beta